MLPILDRSREVLLALVALPVSVLSTCVTKQTGDMEIGELDAEELRFRVARRVV
jgi:hypothetical protein